MNKLRSTHILIHRLDIKKYNNIASQALGKDGFFDGTKWNAQTKGVAFGLRNRSAQ